MNQFHLLISKHKRMFYGAFFFLQDILPFKCPNNRKMLSDFYLVAPNREIIDFLKTMVTSWIDVDQSHEMISPLQASLISGNIKDFKALFQDFVMRCFSYLDVTKNNT